MLILGDKDNVYIINGERRDCLHSQNRNYQMKLEQQEKNHHLTGVVLEAINRRDLQQRKVPFLLIKVSS